MEDAMERLRNTRDDTACDGKVNDANVINTNLYLVMSFLLT